MWSEFKAFLLRGNVLDLAIGVVIANAFLVIVDSIVGDIIGPIIAMLSGGADLRESFVIYGMKWGAFLQAILNFVIIGFVLFLIVKAANKAAITEGEKPA